MEHRIQQRPSHITMENSPTADTSYSNADESTSKKYGNPNSVPDSLNNYKQH